MWQLDGTQCSRRSQHLSKFRKHGAVGDDAPPESSGFATHASRKPALTSLKHSEGKKRSTSSRLQSMRRLSVPLQPEKVSAASGLTSTSGGGSSAARLEAVVPDPKPSCRHATSASALPNPTAQTWLQEFSKNTSRRPICQPPTADNSASLRSPSSATLFTPFCI